MAGEPCSLSATPSLVATRARLGPSVSAAFRRGGLAAAALRGGGGRLLAAATAASGTAPGRGRRRTTAATAASTTPILGAATTAPVAISALVFQPQVTGIVSPGFVPRYRVVSGRLLLASGTASGDAIGILPMLQVVALLFVIIMMIIVPTAAGIASAAIAIPVAISASNSPGQAVVPVGIASSVATATAVARVDVVDTGGKRQGQGREKEGRQVVSHRSHRSRRSPERTMRKKFDDSEDRFAVDSPNPAA